MNKLNQWLTLFANLGVMAGLMFLAIGLKLTNDPFARRMWEDTADEWTVEFAAEVDDIRRSLVKASP